MGRSTPTTAIFFCYRATMKIDLSIGLPSLNKVFSYLLTYPTATVLQPQNTIKMKIYSQYLDSEMKLSN